MSASSLLGAAEAIRTILHKADIARERLVDEQRRNDVLEARAIARADARVRESGKTLGAAEARWKAKRDALRRRAAPPQVPALIWGSTPKATPIVTGWEGDEVAVEAITLFEAAPLDDLEGINAMRRAMGHRLHPDKYGGRYSELLGWANAVLDDAKQAIEGGW